MTPTPQPDPDLVDGFLNELEYQKQVAPNSTATAALQWAKDEIKRYRARIAELEAEVDKKPMTNLEWEIANNMCVIGKVGDATAVHTELMAQVVAATIERCAQVAEEYSRVCQAMPTSVIDSVCRGIAADLRALKDKP